MGLALLDSYLAKHREADCVIALAESRDLFAAARLLRTKFVAREGNNAEAALFQFRVQCLQAVILGSEPAFAGRVDHQSDLASELGEVHRCSGKVVDFQVIQAFGAPTGLEFGGHRGTLGAGGQEQEGGKGREEAQHRS